MNFRRTAMMVLIAASGCSRTPAPDPASKGSNTTPAEVTEAATPAAAPPAVTQGTQPSEAELATALSALTQVVRKFAMEQRRAPKSLDEVVSGGYLQQLPEAPAGKKYTIDRNLQVQLVNR